MARAEANPTPTVLIWARESAGLPVELAAKKAAIGSERLAAWERGEQRPTFAQLRKLSEVYKRPLAIFYLNENVCHFMLLSQGLFLAQKKEVGVPPGARIDDSGKVSGESVGITLISQWKGKGNFQRDLGRPDEFTVSPRLTKNCDFTTGSNCIQERLTIASESNIER